MLPLMLIYAGLLFTLVAGDSVNTISQKLVCRTALKTSSGSGGRTTSSTTIHLSKTVTHVVTPTLTITPAVSTTTKKTTITQTSTATFPQSTNTFSTTLSFTATSTAYTTLISTITSSVTQTTTSTFATTTVQPSSGFVPISSALAAAGHAVAKRARRGVDMVHRDVAAVEKRKAHQQIVCGDDGSITYTPRQYQGAVTCYQRIQVVTTKTVTSTAQKTKSITAHRLTTTITSTATKFTTTTIATNLPLSSLSTATTTTTFSTTLTSTSLLTTFITTLSTTYDTTIPQPTYYAACAPSSNTISYIDETRISNIAVLDPDDQGFSFGNQTSSAIVDSKARRISTQSAVMREAAVMKWYMT
ncbi:hypothetical protein SMMN14_01632 [Sphaerulina musiva]